MSWDIIVCIDECWGTGWRHFQSTQLPLKGHDSLGRFLRAGRKQVSLHFQEGQKSQNAVDRDLWRSSALTVLLKHGHLQQVSQDLAFLVIYKEGDSVTSLGNLWPCSVNFTIKCFLMFGGTLRCFCSCPLPLILSLGREPSSTHFAPFLQYLYTLMRSPQTFLSAGWTVPALFVDVPALDDPYGPTLASLCCAYVSLLRGTPN